LWEIIGRSYLRRTAVKSALHSACVATQGPSNAVPAGHYNAVAKWRGCGMRLQLHRHNRNLSPGIQSPWGFPDSGGDEADLQQSNESNGSDAEEGKHPVASA